MRRGTRVGQAYVAVTADGSGINEEIVDSVDDAGPGVEKAGEEHGERYGGGFSERFQRRLEKVRAQAAEKLGAGLEQDGERTGDRLGAKIGGHVVDALNFALSKEGGENPLSEMFDKITRDSERDADESGERIGRRLGESIAESLGDRIELAVQQIAESIDNIDLSGLVSRNRGVGGGDEGRDFDIGRYFGAGSRNNALNLIGKTIGNITSLATKMTAPLSGAFESASIAMKGAAQNATGFQKIMLDMGGTATGALSSFASMGPAALIAIGAITAALSVLASVLSAVVALATALAATIASALVGALAVGVGAFGALAVAGGLATAAFMSMTDAQRNMLTSAFQPLKAEMVGIGQIMLTQMVPAFQTWSQNLQRALLLAAPIASVMGSAFARAGNILTNSLAGPGFQRVAYALGQYLPFIVRNLATALGGFLNGLAGMFAAVLPYVNRFAGYLANVGKEFSKWANSAKGQNAIEEFMNRAMVALDTLWYAVTQFSGMITDVLFSREAIGAGNTIFDALGDAFSRARKKIAQWIEDGSLQEWFNDAINFGAAFWQLMVGLGDVFSALVNSGAMQFTGGLLGWIGDIFSNMAGPISDFVYGIGVVVAGAIATVVTNLGTLWLSVKSIGEGIEEVAGWLRLGNGGEWKDLGTDWKNLGKSITSFQSSWGKGGGSSGSDFKMPELQTPNIKLPDFDAGSLQLSGNQALNATSQKYGGYMPDPADAAREAAQRAAEAFRRRQEALKALRESAAQFVKDIRSAMSEAAKAASGSEARQAIDRIRINIRETAAAMVETARGIPGLFQRALAQQRAMNKVRMQIARQGRTDEDRIARLLRGKYVQAPATTLADYAVARNRVAAKLEKANQKLEEALTMRSSFKQSVIDSITQFGALTTAVATSINGVEQQLTAADITGNLETRLAQIKKFQANLRLLAGQGLSNDAYKQIVDLGVEGGTAYTEALLSGGLGAVQEVNSLVGQVNNIASQLGTETSSKMYDAGVEAARGLIAGLESLQERLDKAAAKLGRSIASAIRKSLGIKSPSTVMIADMQHVGDGMVVGLGQQHQKVGSAAASLAGQINVSPEVAAYAARNGAPVSGNQTNDLDITVITPTEDPMAVAHEVLNEVTGRL